MTGHPAYSKSKATPSRICHHLVLMERLRVGVHSDHGISPANFELVMSLQNRLNGRLGTDTTHDGPMMIILIVAQLGKEP
jgi:hypothetical protein